MSVIRQAGEIKWRLVDKNGNPTNDVNNYDHADIFVKSPDKPEKIILQLTKDNQ